MNEQVYYLQAVDKYRADVILINFSLAVIPRYLQMIDRGPYRANDIKFSIPDQLMEGTRYMYFYPNQYTADSVDIEACYRYIEENEFIDMGIGSEFLFAPSSKIVVGLPSDCGNTSRSYSFSEVAFLSDFLQLDMIKNIEREKAICFTKECLQSPSLLFRPFLEEEEFILQVNFDKLCR